MSVALSACASDGAELRDPPPSSAAPTVSDDQPDAGFEDRTVDEFVFSSPVIDGTIPVEHTCDGADTSPPLSWEGVPFGAAELAVTVTDPDAGGFVHWAFAGLSPEVTSIPAGSLPEGVVEANNGFGSPGWAGPCPPEEHSYVFTLHVIPEPIGLQPGIEGDRAVDLIETSTIRSVSFTALYGPAG